MDTWVAIQTTLRNMQQRNRIPLTRHNHFHQHFHILENMICECNHHHALLEDLLEILDGLDAFYLEKQNSFLAAEEQGSMT